MFVLYLPRHRENPLLARFFYARGVLVRSVFKGYHEELLQSVYPEGLHAMYLLAADSLEQGGWTDEAEKAREMAADLKKN
jgi:hypothetical protein